MFCVVQGAVALLLQWPAEEVRRFTAASQQRLLLASTTGTARVLCQLLLYICGVHLASPVLLSM